MKNLNVQFIKKSSNAKIGKIPCTNSSRNSCPDSCPLKSDGSCYAEAGFYTKLNWNKLDSGERGGDWSNLVEQVAKIKAGQLWRHNVSGDLPHINQQIDTAKLMQLIAANKGKNGFTYTHHDMGKAYNRRAISEANQQGFTINLSGNNPAHALELAALNIGPVVSIVPADVTKNFEQGGRKFVICPAAIRDDITCADCKMCARYDRKTIIAFPAHGSGKNKIEF